MILVFFGRACLKVLRFFFTWFRWMKYRLGLPFSEKGGMRVERVFFGPFDEDRVPCDGLIGDRFEARLQVGFKHRFFAEEVCCEGGYQANRVDFRGVERFPNFLEIFFCIVLLPSQAGEDEDSFSPFNGG